ncbi:MAG TPA: polysaccharide biosynthesis C-terminal domain-containing protein, partial [Usitatibacter sp.]|nr:polysaccharide biosynthesis C-terminal domain-containing protein [Usitatibacter sp.]
LGKLGVQQSIARFHAEAVAGRRAIGEAKYVRTVLLGMGMTGLAASAGWLIMTIAIPKSWWQDERVAALLAPLSGLVFLRVLDSALTNLLRAQQRSILLSVYLVVRRYLGLGLIVLLIFTVLPGLEGFYTATFAVEATCVVALCVYMVRRHPATEGHFSGHTYRDMLLFGAPMIAYELSSIVLNLGDRYVQQSLLGNHAVGLYSAAYNFCDYVRLVVFTSMAQALTPLYSRLYEESGEAATVEFVQRSLRLYLMVAAAVVAGMAAVGGPVLTILASDKYSPAVAAIPFIIVAMCIDGGTPFFSAGLYLRKRTYVMVPFVIIAAVANLAANMLLVPRLGILGSACSTLGCYVFLSAASWTMGRRYLALLFPFGDLAKFAALAAVMYFAVAQISLASHWLELGVKIAVGVAVYPSLVLAFDRRTRGLVAETLARLARRRAERALDATRGAA